MNAVHFVKPLKLTWLDITSVYGTCKYTQMHNNNQWPGLTPTSNPGYIDHPQHQIIYALAWHNQYWAIQLKNNLVNYKATRNWQPDSRCKGMPQRVWKDAFLLGENRCQSLLVTWGRAQCVCIARVLAPLWPTTYCICLQPGCWVPSAPLLITHYPRFGAGFKAASDTIPLIRVASCC